MAASDDEVWKNRAGKRKAVEGKSEIDIVIPTDRSMIFVEAKLRSDVSLRTTYDPQRNQIIRNIDCLLETAAKLKPFFWMLVKDRNSERDYMGLIRSYRENPEVVSQLLPHRSQAEIGSLIGCTAVLLWSDVVAIADDLIAQDRDDVARVVEELRRRI